MRFYSQYGQDRYIYENYLKNIPRGTFLEIGADDGVDKSNTKFFEDMGWRGICIEPSPRRFKLLNKNRTCICENYAISDTVGETSFLDISGEGKGLSGIIKNYNILHKEKILKVTKHPDNTGCLNITVRTERLDRILQKHKINYVNLCTIDVEGSEYDIVKTINFHQFPMDILLIENNYNDTRVETYLKNYGYRLEAKLDVDDLFIRDE